MKRSLTIMLTAVLMPIPALADMPEVVEYLTAGGGSAEGAVDVGKVIAYNDADNLYFSFRIDDDLVLDATAPLHEQIGKWCITGTHLDVQETLDAIPQTKKGNPVPGRFTYADTYDCVPSVQLPPIPHSWEPGAEVVVAAHANVKQLIDATKIDLEGFEAALPTQVNIKADQGGDSYLNTTISGGNLLNGTYDGWCIDIGHTIYLGTNYTSDVYSSYGELPYIENIDKPENLDLVNYILNTYYADNTPYTMCDIQKAVWTVIDNDPPVSCGAFSQTRVDDIVNDAQFNGEDFVPPCGGTVVVILVSGTAQTTIAQVKTEELGVQCTPVWSEETAWGGDFSDPYTQFPGKNWAFYFPYTIR